MKQSFAISLMAAAAVADLNLEKPSHLFYSI